MSLLLVAPSALGQAPPGGARLSYTRGPGAEGCPDEQALRDVVAAQLGGTDPFVDGGGRHVEVVLGRKGRDFLGEIALHDAGGRRLGGQELTDPACGPLVEDVGTALAIVLRPARAAREPAPPSPAPAPPQMPSEPAPLGTTCPPAPEASPRAPAPAPPCQPCQPAAPTRPAEGPGPSLAWPRLQVSLGALIADGIAPAPAVGFSASVGARWEAFSLSLEGGWHLPVATEPFRGRIYGVSWVGGAVVPCGHVAWFVGCGLVTAGRVRHFGMLNVVREALWPHAGLGLRGGVEVPFSYHLAARLTGELVANLARPTLHLHGGQSFSVARTSKVGAVHIVASF
ncbi:hypothetical protein [Sorangium sp. So ce854]|uniref:hypothetical protein n=1 Tax=Sorangium sp. So ce854 TaxID=3133322 RepID=UPI003F646C15